ncbi:MAG: calcium-binding protein [Nitrososphaeraceae archaeon]
MVNGLDDVFSMVDVQSISVLSTGLEDNIITCSTLICTGTAEADLMIGSPLNEEISGLEGDDVIQGNNGEDVIYGGDGSDSIQGGGGLDNIFGQDGNDYIYADSSTSLSSVLVGNETAIVERLNDKLLGLVEESMITKAGGNGISNVFASLNDNMLIFSESYLHGGEGDDHLFGGSDNDVLEGGPGNDFFECNEGLDKVLDFDPDEDTANVDCEMLE